MVDWEKSTRTVTKPINSCLVKKPDRPNKEKKLHVERANFRSIDFYRLKKVDCDMKQLLISKKNHVIDF